MATRTYSPSTSEALSLMGLLIKHGRKEMKLTAQALADKVGVSRGLIQRIEQGDPKSEIGVVFEVATLLGVSLFSETIPKSVLVDTFKAKISVLPQSVRSTRKQVVSNDF